MRKAKSLESRFFDKVAVIPFHECWEWIGAKIKGYGSLSGSGRPRRTLIAHQVSLQLHGFDIPKGMHVDHKCRNRSCVNPQHLRIVTPRINAIENSDCPSAINAKKTHCIHGHELSIDNLVGGSSKYYGRQCKTCARIRAKKKKSI